MLSLSLPTMCEFSLTEEVAVVVVMFNLGGAVVATWCASSTLYSCDHKTFHFIWNL